MYKFKIPCSDCIVLPTCFNKSAYEIACCELLEPAFYERCKNLSKYDQSHNKLEVKLAPLNDIILLVRESRKFGSIYTINSNTHLSQYVRLVYLMEGEWTK